jgi:PAS domain S-box-containing protein
MNVYSVSIIENINDVFTILKPSLIAYTWTITGSLIPFLIIVIITLLILFFITIRIINRRNEKAKEHVNDIFNRITDAFVALDNNWCYTYMNKRAGEIFFRDPAAMIGKNIWKEFPEGIGQPFYKAYYEAKETQQYIYLEEYYPPYDKWFENHIYPSPEGISIFFRDITCRKKAEEVMILRDQELSRIYSTVEDSIFMLAHEKGRYKFISINDAFLKATGLERSTVEGKFVDEVIPEPSLSVVLKKYRQATETGKSVEWEEETVYPSGIKTGIVKVTPVFNASGNVNQLVGVVHDVTQRKKHEEELERTTEDLIQRNAVLEQFSYMVSHNVRGPVANIVGCLNVLEQFNLDEESTRKFREGLVHSVHKLDRVTKDLNQILQIKSSEQEKRECINLPRLWEEVKLGKYNIIQRENVKFISNFEIEEIYSVKSYWYSILSNLLSNSLKYRKNEEEPVIVVETRKIDNKLLMLFKDNGIGFDFEKRKEQVFGLYKRFHSHTEGKGLGLYMTKAQVEALGGKITVDSEVEKGTMFNILMEVE